MFKNPITDVGKKSKKGKLTLEIENGNFVTKQEGEGDPNKVSFCFKWFLKIASIGVNRKSSLE